MAQTVELTRRPKFQIAHGFSRAAPLKFDESSATFALAKADSEDNARVVGICNDYITSNTFMLAQAGDILKHMVGLDPGAVYYLSPVGEGQVTTTKPDANVVELYQATSETEAIVLLRVLGATSGGSSGDGSVDDDSAYGAHLAATADAHPASAISYLNSAYPLIENVQNALDQVLFFAMTASISGGSDVEIGSSVATVSLTWSFNKDISAQVLTGTGTSAPALADRAQVATGPYTTDQTFTIQGTSLDASETPSNSTQLLFKNKRYWGVSANTTLTDAQIIALSKELSTSRVQSRTLSPSGQYIYFAWPASFGTPSFTVNGLLNTAWSKVRAASAFVNASGASVSYDLWRSDNLLTATYAVDVA